MNTITSITYTNIYSYNLCEDYFSRKYSKIESQQQTFKIIIISFDRLFTCDAHNKLTSSS